MTPAISSKNRQLDLATPVVMGIINATPDSFYSKGQASNATTLLRTVEKMLKDGAAIIDIGGASTRPGQSLLQADDELKRVIPAVAQVHTEFPDAWISIDTYNSRVAQEAVAAGAHIVNDVSSGKFDDSMWTTVAALGVPYIAMHMQGAPETMQVAPSYSNVVTEVQAYLAEVCAGCTAAGITEVIIDPGFGFGKTVEHNFQLLRSMNELKSLGKPVLAGLSRKSMICKPLKLNPDRALNGTTALNMVALQQGANILRVHDVKEAIEAVKLYQLLQSS